MTIAELITALQRFPADMRVVIPGYEMGFDDASPLSVRRAGIDDNADPDSPSGKMEWWMGRHSSSDDEASVDVLLIGGERND